MAVSASKKTGKRLNMWRLPNVIFLAGCTAMITAMFLPVASHGGMTYVPLDIALGTGYERHFGQEDSWKSILRYEVFLVPIIAGMGILFEVLSLRRGQNSIAIKICAALAVPVAALLVLTYFGVHPVNLRPEHTSSVLPGGWLMLAGGGACLLGAFINPKPLFANTKEKK